MPPPSPYKTTHAANSSETFIKPGELIDVVEITPLTLQDRRIYNLLLANAWDSIENDVVHVIPKKELRGSHNVNDRVGESIERLMGALVKVKTTTPSGKEAITRIQLLAPNTEEQTADGLIYYRFPAELRNIIKQSRVFARLQKKIICSFNSKYALSLYEMVQKRGPLKYKNYEEFTVKEFRDLLGVAPKKLKTFSNFNKWAIKPAVEEVSFLSEYNVSVTPIRAGRSVSKLRLAWERKEQLELQNVVREHTYSETGRFVRMNGTAEPVTEIALLHKNESTETSYRLSSKTMETAKGIVLKAGTGWDIYAIESEFERYAQQKGIPDHPDRAFIGFVKKKVKQRP